VPQLNGHQPDANYAGAYNGTNYADYEHSAQYRDNPYRDNMWYEGLPPPAAVGCHLYVYQCALPLLTSASLKNLEGQYTHPTNPNIGYPAPGNAQPMVVPQAPGPSRQEYIPPANVRSSLLLAYPAYGD
jgi:hypothetical protein